MHESNDPMKKQLVYAEGKSAFADGRRRVSNPYRWRNKELASIWINGWDQAKIDNVVKKNRVII
jgi:ribosome modulation factor